MEFRTFAWQLFIFIEWEIGETALSFSRLQNCAVPLQGEPQFRFRGFACFGGTFIFIDRIVYISLQESSFIFGVFMKCISVAIPLKNTAILLGKIIVAIVRAQYGARNFD